jgi:hypothetical protein
MQLFIRVWIIHVHLLQVLQNWNFVLLAKMQKACQLWLWGEIKTAKKKPQYAELGPVLNQVVIDDFTGSIAFIIHVRLFFLYMMG